MEFYKTFKQPTESRKKAKEKLKRMGLGVSGEGIFTTYAEVTPELTGHFSQGAQSI